MSEEKTMRLNLVAKKTQVGTETLVKHLASKGHKIENNPNAKLNLEQLKIVAKDFSRPEILDDAPAAPTPAPVEQKKVEDDSPILYRRDDVRSVVYNKKPDEPQNQPQAEPEKIEAKAETQFKVLGKIDLATGKPIEDKKPVVEEAPKPQPVAEVKPVVEAPKAEVIAPVEPKPQPAVESVPIPAKPASQPPVAEAPKVEPQQPTVPRKIDLSEFERDKQLARRDSRDGRDNRQGDNRQGGNRDNRGGQNQGGNRDNRGGGQNSNNRNDNRSGQNQGGNRDNRGGGQNQNNRNDNRGGQNQGGNRDNRGGGNNNPTPRPDQRPQPPRKEELPKAPPVVEQEEEEEVELIQAKGEQLRGLKVLGKIELPTESPRGGGGNSNNRRKRKRISKGGERVTEKEMSREPGVPRPAKDNKAGGNNTNSNNNNNNKAKAPNQGQGGTTQGQAGGNQAQSGSNNNNKNKKKGKGGGREEVSQKEVQDQIKATMARMSGGTNKPAFGAKERRERRKQRAEAAEAQMLQDQEDAAILKVTEFISVSDLASLMDIQPTEIISACMSIGMFVSINQRLEGDIIKLIAEEFGFEVQFVSAEEEIEAEVEEEEDTPESLIARPPIVTVMGHVDHGKTSLLDYIRRAKVAAGEAGGITQHIGAYSVKTTSGERLTFLDTPGHEAFTAMRARGAKVTDVAIIVISADDSVMPQTREAINHAQVAGVPIVFAFSKVDKAGANTDKIRTELSQMDMNVVEWGGKYESQEISSKSGLGIDDLMEKVLLEAALLELKANPKRKAQGTIVEASLDKGRGYVANILVQTGTLKVGDMMLAGSFYGRVKAMFDSAGKKIKEAGPSMPVQVLGLSGAPAAGDKLQVLENEREAREIANKREQIMREQSLRTRRHITLEEIGRRKAIGTFKELNIIIKGDVDGSVEALSDALLKLSTEEVQVRIIHKAVGQVSESDVLLASASDGIIVAFQVRPSNNAKRLAEQEQIEIRTYSIIYKAIEEIKQAMEGMLAPTFEEHVTANIDVREVYKISKVGTVAGCYVLDGTVKRNNKIRIIRDFIVVHEGEISALKRFKDDVAEVKFGYECGLSIKNFHDIQLGDTIECYELKEVKRTL
jgi:translation initiation factor IF-2